MDDKISTKGLDNTHELLKQADVDDDNGMVKYSIDLDDGEEKLTNTKGKGIEHGK
jgi:hypothetical protein